MTTFLTSILAHLICHGNSMATMLEIQCYLETMTQHQQSPSLVRTGSKMGRFLELSWRVGLLRKTRLLQKLQGCNLLLRIWICSQRMVFPLLVRFKNSLPWGERIHILMLLVVQVDYISTVGFCFHPVVMFNHLWFDLVNNKIWPADNFLITFNSMICYVCCWSFAANL